MTSRIRPVLASLVVALTAAHSLCAQSGGGAGGWLSWRGPQQNGSTAAAGLPSELRIDGDGLSWNLALPGRGTPVIQNGRVFTLAYEGEREELQEKLICLDERTGERLWEYAFTEMATDTIYYRFSLGSPTIDPQTGKVYTMSTSGLLACFQPATGEMLWERSMMEEYGRLSFPNGRTGAPVIDGDLCMVHVVTSHWGPDTPARDRFYAFDKETGVSVWSSTPGGPPKDVSFSFPVVTWEGDLRVLYAGLGGGHVVCVDALTGDPLWKFQLSIGGLSSSPILFEDLVIACHGKENLDSSRIGRMVALKRGARPAPGEGPLVRGKEAEAWRLEMEAFTSSPILVDDRLYLTNKTGELVCIEARTGEVRWREKLATDQIHASPLAVGNRIYAPMNDGSLHVVEPGDDGGRVVQSLQLEGNCLGGPAVANGRLYVHTTERLYCFAGEPTEIVARAEPEAAPAKGEAVRLQILPANAVLGQGDTKPYRVRALDASGQVVDDDVRDLQWSGAIGGPGLELGPDGLKVADDAAPRVGMLQVASGDLKGSGRLRILPRIPFSLDFDDVQFPDGANAGPVPPWWASAGGLKWEVLDLDGERVVGRRVVNPLFQRTMSWVGHPDETDYTVSVDIYADGNRRTQADGGVVNQRYLVRLRGNYQVLEISSNEELLKRRVDFPWKYKKWYRLKTRVDSNGDGTGTIRAKAWARGDDEPEGWLIEVETSHLHPKGAPGIYGFTPQNRVRVYFDNYTVTPNS